MVHLLAKHGAQWRPADRSTTNDARRSFLQMKSDYVVEFVWIMSKYKSCSREDVEELLRTPTMKGRIIGHKSRIAQFMGNLPSMQELGNHDEKVAP